MNFEKRFQKLKLEASLTKAFKVLYNKTKGTVSTGDSPSQLRKLVRQGKAVKSQCYVDWNGDTIIEYRAATTKD